ncbi:formate dehydrogenase accessory sulfurtransferase FdhD [Geomicrobium sp. JSM 1781026]|uniref:formate dehydrogenase accessory sulfurtransferase FdhD n=1 Tax=Geomicrobium sp. JSM 1781026 TaxID=3344580 RepID=UPI0035C1EB33
MTSTTTREIVRFHGDQRETVQDTIASEMPVTIKINGEEFVTLICSPTYIEDMAIGFLASEGVISGYSDVKTLRVDEGEGFVHIYLHKEISRLHQDMQTKRYITSCCGMSRQSLIFAADAKTAKTMHSRNVQITSGQCYALMEALQKRADVFKHTGGVHNAAIATTDDIALMRLDIGRHNALDKLYGHCLRTNISLENKLLIFSGRLSSEIVLKAAKIGCEMILSKSAPTERALEIAEELEITAIGFIRKQSMNVYTIPERVVN